MAAGESTSNPTPLALAMIAATIIFVIGLVIRVRSEEKLLRAEFGEGFEEYAKRVPAVVPGSTD